MIVVAVFEPRRKGEPALSLINQLHGIYGPFESEAHADAWIARFQEWGDDHRFTYHITTVDAPPERR